MNRNERDFNYNSIDYHDDSFAVKDISRAQQERKERRDRELERKNQIRERRRKVNRNRHLLLYAAFVICLLLVGMLGNNVFELWKLQREKEAKETELQDMNRQLEALTEELEQVNTDEYIEQQARSELHMIRPGETLYVFEDKN